MRHPDVLNKYKPDQVDDLDGLSVLCMNELQEFIAHARVFG